MTRYPFAPIDEWLPTAPKCNRWDGDSVSLAERLGINDGVLSRLRRSGLTMEQADRFALRLGTHPSRLWPSWCADALQPGSCQWCGGAGDGPRKGVRCHQDTPCLTYDRWRERCFWKRLDRWRGYDEAPVLRAVAA